MILLVHYKSYLNAYPCFCMICMAFQDDRTCWMEAISADSSAAFKPEAPESQYEPVTPIPEGEMYSYARMSRSERYHQAQERKDLKSLYEDPDAPITIQVQAPNQSQPNAKGNPPQNARQARNERARSKSPVNIPSSTHSKSPINVPSSAIKQLVPENKTPTISPATSSQHVPHAEILSGDKGTYDDVDATAGLGVEEYEDMSQQNPSLQAKTPERSVTVPKELSALAEISVDDLSGMNPNEAQLWMLNQMQKLVEKFAGVYGATAVGPLTKEIKSNRGKLLPAQTEDVYEDAQSTPPVPPRTYSYSVEKTYQEESDLSTRKISRQSKSVNVGTKSSAERSPHHHSKVAYPPLPQKPGINNN